MFCLPVRTAASVGGWRNEASPEHPGFDGPDLWVEVARKCEAAKFDFIMAADTEGIMAEYGNSRDATLREGLLVPAFDQTALADFMAAGTKEIGIVSTVSTTAIQPYLLARRFATMDHLSHGRTGWNIVTASHKAGVKGFGMEQLPPHDERYDRADELVDLCKLLWNSWDEGAIVADRERDMYIDPSKVHDVNFEGRWFKCYAPLNVHRSPQGGPMLVQAGASGRGITFAARHAELIIAIQPSPQLMRNYRNAIHEAVSKAGRDPSSSRVMFAMHTFIGDSEAEAREKHARHLALLTPERAMVATSGTVGLDLASVDPMQPLAELDFPGAKSHVANWARLGMKNMREVSLAFAAGLGIPVIGTPTQVADWMCDTMDFVGGDGLFLTPQYIPYDLAEFTAKVIPILQKRGKVRQQYAGKTLRDNMFAF
jgi:FMN-dependent oxidoreductase (nitrilotriacetate monooxygenase family)